MSKPNTHPSLDKTQSLEETTGSVHVAENLHAPQTWGERFLELKKSWRATLASIACSSLAVLIGYDLTLIGSIIANREFVIQFGLYDQDLQVWTLPASRQLVWTICQFVAAIVGAFIVGTLNDMFGRRICFFLTVALTMIGTVTELFSPDWKVWVVAKVLFGLAMGFMQGNTPTYISELAPIHIRGFLLSLFQFWITLGSFLASCVLEGTSHIQGRWSWKAAVVSQFGLGLLSFALFILLVPESPYYLTSKAHYDTALKALQTLRGRESGYSAEADLEVIKTTISHERENSADQASFFDCFKGVDRRRTFLACLPMVMQQFSGFPLCGNYLAYFLSLSGLSNAFLITVISNLLSIVAIGVAFSLIEQVGRRPQLLFGIFFMVPCLIAISILGWVGVGTGGNGRALAAFSVIWNVLYFLSLGAIGWTIVGEISSTRLRAKTTAIATAVNAVINMAWAIAIPYLINADEANLGPKAGLIFLGPLVFLSFIAFWTVPETKGKSFSELDNLFEMRTPARKF
ncbi:uncharacterized protein NECHADRAFT_39701 [Fusarium vanettenii 77-13-4]|uniref:Major facilitator superfamily (MFS) profile domain-containing protein n=1 Tax=Fusarium vanettenii (strain ATCC MYA-4622 / CBS 123669 / FGSC 9596 / NRRL 45880 / 77-13-4) TaxID=660122 RepID=C7ZM55_FUSV7|nr:uncharacterized protein NECHADRAFT_39701 [Fusarium vanettenii 77-13-4]EEU34908.1 hypothetical protein NECHADRAFT_39701 [Fusarium vanettenii 77-13-4]